jgi:hypothetical protein
MTDYGVPRPAFRPMTQAEKLVAFGDPTGGVAMPPGATRFAPSRAWRDECLAPIECEHELAGDLSRLPKTIWMHQRVAPRFVELWNEWDAQGIGSDVLTWGGTLAWRLVRGGTTLSSHAFGGAFDINVAWNGLAKPVAPEGAKGSVVRLARIAEAHGWAWGGRFSRPDGMHFEFVARND